MYSNDQLVGQPLLAAAGNAAAALGTAVRGCAWQLADDQVQDAIAVSLQIEARNAALRATLLAEANLRGLRERTQSSTTERWLADRYRLSHPDARARVEQAHVFVRHPRVVEALTEGSVTVEQASVIAHALDQVADLPLVEEDEREQAADLLIEQSQELVPRELARAGQQIVQHLTRTPSVDDPAEEDAIAREQRRAQEEAEAAQRDRASWRHRLRPGRRGRGTLDTGPIGDALIKAWEHAAGRKHPGTDGFEDDRTRDQRLGQALLDLMADYLGQPRPQPRLPDQPQDSDQDGDDDQDSDEDQDTDGCIDAPLLLDDEPITGCDAPAVGRQPGGPGWAGSATRARARRHRHARRAARRPRRLPGCGRRDARHRGRLTAAELRLLACDAGIVPAVLGSPSQVLDLGPGHPQLQHRPTPRDGHPRPRLRRARLRLRTLRLRRAPQRDHLGRGRPDRSGQRGAALRLPPPPGPPPRLAGHPRRQRLPRPDPAQVHRPRPATPTTPPVPPPTPHRPTTHLSAATERPSTTKLTRCASGAPTQDPPPRPAGTDARAPRHPSRDSSATAPAAPASDPNATESRAPSPADTDPRRPEPH